MSFQGMWGHVQADGSPGLLKTCCEASRGCEAYSTVTGDPVSSGHAMTLEHVGPRAHSQEPGFLRTPWRNLDVPLGATSISKGLLRTIE